MFLATRYRKAVVRVVHMTVLLVLKLLVLMMATILHVWCLWVRVAAVQWHMPTPLACRGMTSFIRYQHRAHMVVWHSGCRMGCNVWQPVRLLLTVRFLQVPLLLLILQLSLRGWMVSERRVDDTDGLCLNFKKSFL